MKYDIQVAEELTKLKNALASLYKEVEKHDALSSQAKEAFSYMGKVINDLQNPANVGE